MTRMQVIVPARDQEQEIATCLCSIAESIRRLPEPWNAGVVVVCDACSDATADRARQVMPDATVLICNYASADNARARGARYALEEHEAQWLAFTHADVLVTPDWLALQLARSDAGFDAAAGLIEVAQTAGMGRGPRHQPARSANLGVCAMGYRRSGGFAVWPCHEKRDVLQSLKLRNGNICWDTQSIVARVRIAPAAVAANDERVETQHSA